MHGEFLDVWSDTWREIWLPLVDRQDVPEDIFCELYRELEKAFKFRLSIQALADIIDNPLQSRQAFEQTKPKHLAGERELVAFFEAVHDALEELGGCPRIQC